MIKVVTYMQRLESLLRGNPFNRKSEQQKNPLQQGQATRFAGEAPDPSQTRFAGTPNQADKRFTRALPGQTTPQATLTTDQAQPQVKKISRREFLRLAGLTAAGVALSGCGEPVKAAGPAEPASSQPPTPNSPLATPTVEATAQPTIKPATPSAAATKEATKTAINTPEATAKQENKSPYELAFKLPLKAEVVVEGVPVNVDLLLGLTKNFVKTNGLSQIELAEPQRFPEIAGLVVHGAYEGWKIKNPGNKLTLKEWLESIKSGKQVNIDLPTVDITKPFKGRSLYDTARWSPTIDPQGKLTMKVGLVYGGKGDLLPFGFYTTIYGKTIKSGSNLYLTQDGRLNAIWEFFETPAALKKGGAFGNDESVLENVANDFLSSNTVAKLSFMFCADKNALTKNNTNPYDKIPSSTDKVMAEKRIAITLPMSNNTPDDYSDDKPILKLTK